MREEDFVLGYAVGFNDGASGGGGRGSVLGFDDITLIKKYKMLGTDYAMGFSAVNSDLVMTAGIWDSSYGYGNTTEWNNALFVPEFNHSDLYFIVVLKNDSAVALITLEYTNSTSSYNRSDAGRGDWTFTQKEWRTLENLAFEYTERYDEYKDDWYKNCEINIKGNRLRHNLSNGEQTDTSDGTVDMSFLFKNLSWYNSSAEYYKSMSFYQPTTYQMWAGGADGFKDFMQAWWNCTGIEEVSIT